MIKTKVYVLPMSRYQWEKAGVEREGALLTTINIAEGEILEFMEGKGEISLTEIVNQFEWPEPIVMMAIGGLIKEGLLIARRNDIFIWLTRKN